MQFRNGRNRQYRVLRSVNHPPRRGNEGWPGLENGLKWRVESAYLNYNIPTSWAQESCPVGRPTCPFRPASRNLINLPVASSLAPCHRSEILYPSHPLKPTATHLERSIPSLLAHLSVSVYSILSLLSSSPFFSLLLPPSTRSRARVLATQREHPLIVRISLNFIRISTRETVASGTWYETSVPSASSKDICETFCFFLLLLWFFCYLFSFFLEILFRFQLMNGGKI